MEQYYKNKVEHVAEILGDRTPEEAKKVFADLCGRIAAYEGCGPIDMVNEKNVDPRRTTMLGGLCIDMAKASIIFDALLAHYGIRWEAIDRNIGRILEKSTDDELSDFIRLKLKA